MKKRIISLALCLLMVLGYVLPVAAVDSAEPACSGDCEDTSSAATHVATCAVYAYYESMSAKGAAHLYENWDGISESDQANLLVWLEAHDPDTAAELKALLGAEEETEPETTAPDETTEPSGEAQTETISNGSFTVTGNLPEGAELVIGEYPTAYSADEDTPSVSMYSIKVYDGDEVWQPEDGETVKVSIPVTGSASTVNVVHFLEDPDKISYALANGLAQTVDLSMADGDEGLAILEDAIAGYRAATGSSATCVVVEAFENVPVVNGKVTVNANGFSVFTSVPPAEIVEASNEFTDLPESKSGDVVYVRPGEWIRFEGVAGIYTGYSVKEDASEIVEIINEESGLFQSAYTYFHVSDDAKAEQTFTIKYVWSIVLYTYTREVTFQVVDDFDYGNVRICVLPLDYVGYPNELSNYTNVGFKFYTPSDTLTEANTIYSTSPRTLIDVDNLKKSSYYVSNDTQTVYGISDSTGAITSAYLTDDFDAISEKILKAYYDDNWENYKLIVYAVKYEAIGDNVGWYINCKAELKSNFILSYDYNAPSPLTEFNIGNKKKPSAQSVPTYDEEGNPKETVTTTVDDGSEMELSNTIDTTSYKATFVGWNTDPDADPNEENKTAANGWYFGGDEITMTGDTTLYAIWEFAEAPTIAEVKFQKHVIDEDGNAVTSADDSFTFTVSSNFAGLTYKVYTADGFTQVASGTFSADALTFELKNGQYIVIKDVPNSTTAYTITETVPAGYSAQDGAAATFNINETTNTSGKFTRDFINILQKYPVTYLDGVADEEIEVPAAQEKIKGTALTLSATKPTRTGYNFTGWLGSDGETYQAGGTYKTDAALTLTAQWELITYTVSYDLDGGSGTFVNQTKEYGKTLMLHSAEPTREGYKFTGWLGSDGKTYQADSSYTENAALTLTAQWTAQYQYQLTFSENTTDTVSGMPTGYSSTGWEDVSSKEITWTEEPTRTGYNFLGWNIDKNATTGSKDKSYTLTGTAAGTTSVTLYAIWTPTEYTITYNLDGGTVSGNPESYTIESGAITLNNPTREGYTFNGWSGTGIDSTSTSVTIPAGSTGNRSYTANWMINTYAVTYADGVDGEEITVPAAQVKTYGVDLTLSADAPTRTGYKFTGWNGSDGSTYQPGAAYTGNAALTLTATWTPLYKYVLVFDANTTDATVSGMPAGYTSADWEETSSCVYNISGQPTRTGYTFKGWSTTANAESGEMISSITLNGVPADTKTVTLYAVWKANTYTITLNTDGGDAISAKDYTIENDIKLPTPTKTGFEFQGWQVEVTDGNWAAVGTSVSLGVGTGKYGNVTLKAIWKGLYSYQLTFNANQPAAVTGWSVQNMPTSDSTDWIGEATHTFRWSTNPTLKGYTFKGWATSADGTATYSDSIQLTGTPGEATSQTLYAIWEENTVTITYQAEANGQVSMESETIGVVTGSPVGATATPVSYYQFVGWYKDDTEICESEQFNAFEKVDGLYVAGTYTAKFELAQTDLTIYANGGDGEQTYLYTVTGTGVSLTVAVPQGGHVTIKGLPVGTYTVTEKSDWTWRYSPTGGATQTVVVDSVAETVTFEHTANSNTQWLNGYDYKAFN